MLVSWCCSLLVSLLFIVTTTTKQISCSSQQQQQQQQLMLGYRSVVMSPRDALVATGETLEVNCTLIRFPSHVTADQIEFQPIRSSEAGGQEVDIVDALTARLRYHNVQRSETLGHVFCKVRKADNEGWMVDEELEPYWEEYGHVSFRVADLPEIPRVSSCVVYNWESMDCSWEPALQNTGLITNQTLYWRIVASDPWSICPNVVSEPPSHCRWLLFDGRSSFRYNLPYTMFVSAVNQLAPVDSLIYTFNTAHIVKPNPVSELVVETKTSRSMKLFWLAPRKYTDLLYRVTVSSEGNVTQPQTHTMNSSSTISDLTPFTVYHVSIVCIPVISSSDGQMAEPRGYWSLSANVSARTLPDVPGALPLVTSGGYQSERCQQQTRCLQVYWQQVAARWRHGSEWIVRIRYRSLTKASDWMELTATQNITSVLIKDLSAVDQYELTVDARNELGFNDSLQPQTLVIPAHTDTKTMSFVVVTDGNTGVSLNWSSVADSVGYTVYWCQRGLNVAKTERCKQGSQLNWRNLPSTVNSYMVDISQLSATAISYHELAFAWSVDFQLGKQNLTTSSGLMWSDCTYNINNEIRPPVDVWFTEHQQGNSLQVEWTKPECSETGFIAQFVVSYCRHGDNCADTDKHEVTSVNASMTSVLLVHLSPDEVYEVRVKSVSVYGESNFTVPILQRVLRKGLTRSIVVFITISSILVSTFLVIGVITVTKKCRTSVHRLSHVKIVLPDRTYRPSTPTMCSSNTRPVHGHNVYVCVPTAEVPELVPSNSAVCDTGSNGYCTTACPDIIAANSQRANTVSPYTQTYIDNQTKQLSNTVDAAHITGSLDSECQSVEPTAAATPVDNSTKPDNHNKYFNDRETVQQNNACRLELLTDDKTINNHNAVGTQPLETDRPVALLPQDGSLPKPASSAELELSAATQAGTQPSAVSQAGSQLSTTFQAGSQPPTDSTYIPIPLITDICPYSAIELVNSVGTNLTPDKQTTMFDNSSAQPVNGSTDNKHTARLSEYIPWTHPTVS